MAAAARDVWQDADRPREGGLPPRGRRIALSGRGDCFVRTLKGPRDALPVVLLHGWVASGGLNWFRAFEPLRQRFRVIAPDMRGHARGIRSFRPFRLEDCADDVAALLDALGTGPAVVVGYSMGGPIAQLLWRRHPQKVAGLVMVATSARPVRTDRSSNVFSNLMGGAALAARIAEWSTWLPRQVALGTIPQRQAPAQQPESLARWARAEMRRHSFRHLFEAGAEISRYDARTWIGSIDVPTAVVVTERDSAVLPALQRSMADDIPASSVHSVDDGHLSCASTRFGRVVVDACRDVEKRVEG